MTEEEPPSKSFGEWLDDDLPRWLEERVVPPLAVLGVAFCEAYIGNKLVIPERSLKNLAVAIIWGEGGRYKLIGYGECLERVKFQTRG